MQTCSCYIVTGREGCIPSNSQGEKPMTDNDMTLNEIEAEIMKAEYVPDCTFMPAVYRLWLLKNGRGFKSFDGVSELDAARAAYKWLKERKAT